MNYSVSREGLLCYGLDPDLGLGKALASAATGVISSSSFLGSASVVSCAGGVGVGVSPRERGCSVSSRGVGLFFKFMAAGLVAAEEVGQEVGEEKK